MNVFLLTVFSQWFPEVFEEPDRGRSTNRIWTCPWVVSSSSVLPLWALALITSCRGSYFQEAELGKEIGMELACSVLLLRYKTLISLDLNLGQCGSGITDMCLGQPKKLCLWRSKRKTSCKNQGIFSAKDFWSYKKTLMENAGFVFAF